MSDTERRYPELLLLPRHEELLASSGISPEVATARGYKSAKEPRDLKIFGFSDAQRRAPALVIPIWSVTTGKIVTYQARPDMPRANAQDKQVKYETPRGARMVLDCHPIARDWSADPGRPLFITEGIRKADAAVSRGLCCVALLGVWNWRGKNEKGGFTALADWESVALKDRQAYVAYDSDVMLNPQVHAALARLKTFLESRGAQVALIRLPPGEGGAKIGLDDFLASGRTVEELLVLAKPEARRSAEDAPSRATVDVEPHPQPVDGAKLVEELMAFFMKHAVLPAGGALVLALWAIATWLSDIFDAFPYLAITSPQKECGKSRVLKLLQLICKRPLPIVNISEAALFRVIEKEAPTLLIDEAQQLRVRDERSAALHDLLCAGYQRGSFVYRMAGANRDKLQRFGVYCPKAIALIGRPTDVLMDRAIEIRMRRRTKTEQIDRFFLTRPPAEVERLRQQNARWAADHMREVREMYLTASLPDWLEDREAELWAPFLAIARMAIPSRASEVECITRIMSSEKARADDSMDVRLLADLRTIFGEKDFLPTKEIIAALVAIEEAPWSEYQRGKPLTARGLAELLKPFEIEPGKARYDARAGVRGYFRGAFQDAWERYPPSNSAADPPQAPQPWQDKAQREIFDPPQTPLVADGEIAGNTSRTGPVADVADCGSDKGVQMNGEIAEDELGDPPEPGSRVTDAQIDRGADTGSVFVESPEPAPAGAPTDPSKPLGQETGSGVSSLASSGSEPKLHRLGDDGRRTWVLAMGKALGWPSFSLGPGRSIVNGERYWRIFAARASDGDLAAAVAALMRTDTTAGGPQT